MDFIKTIDPPAYPFATSTSSAAIGFKIFQKKCQGCHGTHNIGGALVKYENKVINIEKIETDPERLWVGLTKEFREDFSDSWLGDYGQADVVLEPTGYVAPPLVGFWASAPYFHNASVPTVRGVLSTAHRPKVWLKQRQGYNQKDLGLNFEVVTRASLFMMDREKLRWVYDTEKFSQNNSGHEVFRAPLRDAEINQLIEFMKQF